MLSPDPLESLVFGGGKLGADRGRLGMLGAVCVVVSRARARPVGGWSAGLRFCAGARLPSWARREDREQAV